MSDTPPPLTKGEWDKWRDSRLTRKCIAMIAELYQERFGAFADEQMRDNYGAIFADPQRQAEYAMLRGQVAAATDIKGALDEELKAFIETEEDEDDENN